MFAEVDEKPSRPTQEYLDIVRQHLAIPLFLCRAIAWGASWLVTPSMGFATAVRVAVLFLMGNLDLFDES